MVLLHCGRVGRRRVFTTESLSSDRLSAFILAPPPLRSIEHGRVENNPHCPPVRATSPLFHRYCFASFSAASWLATSDGASS
jgi:hypothetical protein